MSAFVYSPQYEMDIGAHVFPTRKYRLVRDQAVRQGLIDPAEIEAPVESSDEDLRLVHTAELLDDLRHCRWTQRTSRGELPLSASIVQAFRLAVGGAILASQRALERRWAFHCGGGFHHAFPDHAEGFCLLNDIAVALRVLLRERRVRRPLVVDCDLHQGNGTAHSFQETPEVFTFSIHEENNYPPKRQRSDLDIGLPVGMGDDEYLAALSQAIPALFDRHECDFLYYVAGADPFHGDQLGGLTLTKSGLRRRDDMVLQAAAQRSIPFVITLAGGYARDLDDVVDIHVATLEAALSCMTPPPRAQTSGPFKQPACHRPGQCVSEYRVWVGWNAIAPRMRARKQIPSHPGN